MIFIHATAWSVPVSAAPLSSPLALVSDFARACVPLFVLASGFALRGRYQAGPERKPEFLGRRWRRTIVPWLCWAPVFALLGFWDGAVPTTAGGVGTWIAYGAGHLYFLLLAAQLYLVFLLLPASRRGLAIAAAAALLLQVALGWLHTYPLAPAGPLGSIAYWLAPYYVGYFLVGALLADLWPDLRRHPALTPVTAIALAGALVLWAWSTTTVPAGDAARGAYAFLWPGRVPLVLALAVAILAWGPGAGLAAMQWLGSRSLGVYLIHPLFLAMAGPAAMTLGPLPRVVALGAGALAFGYLSVAVLTRTHVGSLAVGEAAPTSAEGRNWRVARLSLR